MGPNACRLSAGGYAATTTGGAVRLLDAVGNGRCLVALQPVAVSAPGSVAVLPDVAPGDVATAFTPQTAPDAAALALQLPATRTVAVASVRRGVVEWAVDAAAAAGVSSALREIALPSPTVVAVRFANGTAVAVSQAGAVTHLLGADCRCLATADVDGVPALAAATTKDVKVVSFAAPAEGSDDDAAAPAAPTDRTVGLPAGTPAPTHVALSPNGARVAVVGGGRATVLDVASGSVCGVATVGEAVSDVRFLTHGCLGLCAGSAVTTLCLGEALPLPKKKGDKKGAAPALDATVSTLDGAAAVHTVLFDESRSCVVALVGLGAGTEAWTVPCTHAEATGHIADIDAAAPNVVRRPLALPSDAAPADDGFLLGQEATSSSSAVTACDYPVGVVTAASAPAASHAVVRLTASHRDQVRNGRSSAASAALAELLGLHPGAGLAFGIGGAEAATPAQWNHALLRSAMKRLGAPGTKALTKAAFAALEVSPDFLLVGTACVSVIAAAVTLQGQLGFTLDLQEEGMRRYAATLRRLRGAGIACTAAAARLEMLAAAPAPAKAGTAKEQRQASRAQLPLLHCDGAPEHVRFSAGDGFAATVRALLAELPEDLQRPGAVFRDPAPKPAAGFAMRAVDGATGLCDNYERAALGL